VYADEGGGRFHDHKGFNWRVLRRTIAERFEVEATVTSPFTALPPSLATQVWLLARPRPAGARERA